MAFIIVTEPQTAPASIPEPGGSVIMTFRLSAIETPTAVNVTYTIRDGMPYVFVPPPPPTTPSTVKTGPHTVLVGGTDIVRRLTLAKSPPSAPRVELLFVDIEVVEPGGVAPAQHLTAVITIE
jgi:hypothetical protein